MHKHAICSLQPVRDILLKLDKTVEYLFKKVAETNLMKDLNIIITADHGHTNVYTPYTVVDIQNITETYGKNIN
jgi:hypothetical protein